MVAYTKPNTGGKKKANPSPCSLFYSSFYHVDLSMSVIVYLADKI